MPNRLDKQGNRFFPTVASNDRRDGVSALSSRLGDGHADADRNLSDPGHKHFKPVQERWAGLD